MNGRSEVRTQWPALVLSILLQLPIVAAALLAPYKELDVRLIVAAAPLELVRVIVLVGLGNAYPNYGSSWETLRSFVGQTGTQLAIFALIFLFYWILITGLDETAAALSRPWIWAVIVIPVALLVAENALSLFFCGGDARAQAARFGAMAADAKAWFVLMFAVIPAVFLALFLLACCVPGHSSEVAGSHWIGAVLLTVLRLYPAAYFAGKAIVLAQVHTARFALTGRRVFDADWILWLMSSKGSAFERSLDNERRAIAWRRAAMLGEDPPGDDVALTAGRRPVRKWS
jgi:hypothetical protein